MFGAITALGGADGNYFHVFVQKHLFFDNRRFRMKKVFAVTLLLVCFTISFASDSVIHNPQNDVVVAKGKKSEPVIGCTCLFHEIEEFVKGLFS